MDKLFSELSDKELEVIENNLSSSIRSCLDHGHWGLVKDENRKLGRVRRELALRRGDPLPPKRSFWSRLAWWRRAETNGGLSYTED